MTIVDTSSTNCKNTSQNFGDFFNKPLQKKEKQSKSKMLQPRWYKAAEMRKKEKEALKQQVLKEMGFGPNKKAYSAIKQSKYRPKIDELIKRKLLGEMRNTVTWSMLHEIINEIVKDDRSQGFTFGQIEDYRDSIIKPQVWDKLPNDGYKYRIVQQRLIDIAEMQEDNIKLMIRRFNTARKYEQKGNIIPENDMRQIMIDRALRSLAETYKDLGIMPDKKLHEIRLLNEGRAQIVRADSQGEFTGGMQKQIDNSLALARETQEQQEVLQRQLDERKKQREKEVEEYENKLLMEDKEE